MAENERLDGAPTARWRRVAAALQQGESDAALSRRIEKALYGCVRNALAFLRQRGVSLDQLLQAAISCPGEVPGILRMCRHNTFAQLVVDAATIGSSREQVLSEAVAGAWEKVRAQLAEFAVPGDRWSNYTDFYGYIDTFRPQVQKAVERIADCLARNPEWIPQRPATGGRRAVPDESPTLFETASANGASQQITEDERLAAKLRQSILR